MLAQRHDKILSALAKKDGQTFTELLKISKVDRVSLSLGLDELQKEKRIKKTDRIYNLKLSGYAKERLDTGSKWIYADYELKLENLTKSKEPFKEGLRLLGETLTAYYSMSSGYLLEHKLRQTDFENNEMEKVIKRLGQVATNTIKLLQRKDPKQTKVLKRVVAGVVGDHFLGIKEDLL